jgi:HD-like signal output (HDOD) protein
VTLLGLKNIRNLALAYGTMHAIPKTKSDLFDHEAFWNDSLLRAHLARCFTKSMRPDQADEAFTAALLADIAIPILLSVWPDYYRPIIDEWLNTPKRLSQVEREHFGWDHAQAGAWIVRSWKFPDDLVCYIGVHNLSMADLEAHKLEDTIATAIAIAAQSASVLKPDALRMAKLYCRAINRLNLTDQTFAGHMYALKASFSEIIQLFNLGDRGVNALLAQLLAASGTKAVCQGHV